MHILMLNDYFGFSAGAFAIAWEVSGELIKRGHRVTFVCAAENETEAKQFTRDGRDIHLIRTRTPFRLRPLLSMYHPGLVGETLKLIKTIKPDLVHAWLVHLHFSTGLLARLDRKGYPVVMTAQDTGIFCPTKYICKPPYDPAEAATWLDCLKCRRFRYLPGQATINTSLVNRHVKVVTAASDSLASILTANKVQNVTVARAGLDVSKIDGQGWSEGKFRQEFEVGNGPFIMFGARLQENKGDWAALKAMARLDKKVTGKLLLIGAKEVDRPRLEAMIGKLGLDGRVMILGWLTQEQMLGAFRASLAVLVPSMYPDPFPTMNLLGMALSKPVIGTTFGGTPEAVVDGQTGFVVDPREAGKVVECMARLFNDPALAADMGRAGRERLEAQFTVDRQVDAFEDIYRTMV